MDFSLTEDQLMLQKVAREFLDKECPSEFARQCDEKGEFPWALYRKMGDMGWQGLCFPERFGGSNAGDLAEALVVEQIGRVMNPLAACFLTTCSTCGKTLRDFASEEQRQAILPRLVQGQILLAFGLTEPDAGSDAASLKTRAVKKGSDYIVNGQKIFMSGASQADTMLLMVRTDPDVPKWAGISLLLVDPKSSGITMRHLPKMGARSYPTYEVFFDDVRVPQQNLVGEENKAWRYITSGLSRERIACAAMCVGTAQGALDTALRHVKTRVQFGQTLSHFQVVQHKMADMALMVESARLLVYRASWMETKGIRCNKEASMAKVYATEIANKVAYQAMQVQGGYSLMMDSSLQLYYRDIRIHPIGAGSNEILRDVIAKEMKL